MCQLILIRWLTLANHILLHMQLVYEDSWILDYKKESNNQIQYEYFSMKFEIIYIMEKIKKNTQNIDV